MNRALLAALLASAAATGWLALHDDSPDAATDLLPAPRQGAGTARTTPAPPGPTGVARAPSAATARAAAADAPAPVTTLTAPAWHRDAAWPAVGTAALAAWQPPAPPPAPAAARPPNAEPTRPPPPPFPYKVIGRYDDGGGPQVLLAGPQRTLAVAAGESPDRQWRIDRLDGARLTVTWLATGETQTLATRGPE